MSSLYASLRSLLPSESIKGKRAVMDQMGEAVTYIENLNKNIENLSFKRDELKKLSNLSSPDGNASSLDHHQVNDVAIHPYEGGVEIVIINSGFAEGGWHLSILLEMILEEGLDVIHCASTQTDKGTFLYTIQSEVRDPTHLDLLGLQKKLKNLISLLMSTD